MTFLIDESADARLEPYLLASGHDAVYVAHRFGPGLTDTRFLEIARAEARILITDDRDFGELVFRQRQPYAGVIFFRPTSIAITL